MSATAHPPNRMAQGKHFRIREFKGFRQVTIHWLNCHKCREEAYVLLRYLEKKCTKTKTELSKIAQINRETVSEILPSDGEIGHINFQEHTFKKLAHALSNKPLEFIEHSHSPVSKCPICRMNRHSVEIEL